MLRKRMAAATRDSDTGSLSRPLLSVRALTVSYPLAGAAKPSPIPALTGVDLDVFAGNSVGIFGESGCGKSTLLLSIPNLLAGEANSAGSILFGDQDLLAADEQALRFVRGAQIGVVVQEAGTALNPVRRVGEQVAEVLRAHVGMSSRGYREAAFAALHGVGLTPRRIFDSYPHQLSGGQRQRVLVAQALICGPKILLADEPVHALDDETRAGIVQLLQTQAKDSGMALVIASHNAAVLRQLTERLCVMYAGQVVEVGRTAEVLAEPMHPYTRALVACFRVESRTAANTPARMGTIPGVVSERNDGQTGCRFASRCVHRQAACFEAMPELRRVTPTREARCFFA